MGSTTHRYVSLDGLRLFYREAGPPDAPVVLLLHGSPSSSISYRYMLAELSERWRLVAPDLPAFGLTESESDSTYRYTFDNLAATIAHFIRELGLQVQAVYLHDYGAQVGFRLLTSGAIRPRALIIQNSEAYRGVGWREMMWGVDRRVNDPPEEARARLLHGLLSREGTCKEFLEDLPAEMAERVDPVVIELAWQRINRAGTIEARLELMMDYGSNIEQYPKVQECLRAGTWPTLLLWGEGDQYLTPEAAQAYKRDLPNAELYLMDGGHWLLETHSREVNSTVSKFLAAQLT